MAKTVYFLNKSLREVFQPYFTGNKILITRNVGSDLFFYDVNSMYPFAMLKNLPNQYIGIRKVGGLNRFFGFAKVTVVKKPVNHFHMQLEKGIIFSEELKMLTKFGYEFKFHYFIPFTLEKLFDNYIRYFYHIKR